MNLLGSNFLSPSYELEVKKEENAMWHSMFQWSKEKADAWLQRLDGEFNFKVNEQMAKGKKPNLLNQAAQYRDTDPDVVWKISCVKVWAWAEAQKHNSEQRMKDLELAWRRGALDDTMRPHVQAMKKDFKASDIAWVGAPCQGVGELSQLDPMGAAQLALTSAKRESLGSQYREWVQRLAIEAGKHKLWLTEVEAYDSKSESDAQKFRNERATTKDSCRGVDGVFLQRPGLQLPGEGCDILVHEARQDR